MKVKSLSLTNYRGFERLEMEFHPRVNVIAGINGVGKSSVLEALRVAFSHMLDKSTVAKEPLDKFRDDDIKSGQMALDVSVKFEIHDEPAQMVMRREALDEGKREEWENRLAEIEKLRKDGFLSRIPRHLQEEQKDLNAKLNNGPEIYDLILENVTTETRRTGGLDDVERKTSEMLRDFKERPNQPLAVYYSPLRFSGQSSFRTLPEGSPLGTSRAFNASLQERDIGFREFLHWYRWQVENDNPQTQQQREKILAALQQAVTDFVPEFTEMKLQENPLKFMVLKNQQWLSLRQLSDGERGLLGLVFDLARRLALANPEAEEPLKTGQAVVLIDEIELHLHPSWQRRVMKQLQITFPECQFIVTSHSPQVLGEVAHASVRYIEIEDGNIIVWIPDQAIGLDSNMILEFMGSESMNREIKNRIKEAGRLVALRKYEEALSLTEKIKHEINGDNPEIIRLESTIKFLQVKKDD